jgi:23S rRNA pseudouridine1911/1915/1917 synthase
VIGDQTYGGVARKPGAQPPRQFLHAAWLRFSHPVTGAVVDVRSELPADLRALLGRAARDEALAKDSAPLDRLGFFAADA